MKMEKKQCIKCNFCKEPKANPCAGQLTKCCIKFLDNNKKSRQQTKCKQTKKMDYIKEPHTASQTQSSSSSQTREEVLKQLGLSQALINSTIESMTGPFNHQCSIYYVQGSIEEVVKSSPRANSLVILQTCFEEGRARELQTYLVKSNLLKHQSLQYWMHLCIEYISDQVNNKQNIENNGAKQGEWYSINAGNTKNGTWQISCIGLDSEDVDSFVREDSKLRSIVESENH